MQSTLEPSKISRAESGMMNPMIRKLSRITETSDDYATYGGIGGKCAFFMAMILVGAALALVFQTIDPIALTVDGEILSLSPIAMIALAISLLLMVVTPFVAFLIRPAIPVVGSLYCLSTGYVMSFLAAVLPEYRDIILLAMIVTIAIVAVMAVLYAKGWVKVDDKFRTVIKTLFFASIGSGVLLFICSFIPVLKDVIAELMQNALVSILVTAAYVVIASLMLLVDFNTIQRTVENRLPRKYEWIAAFGLAFSVIWLFLKVLSLISKVKDGSGSSSK